MSEQGRGRLVPEKRMVVDKTRGRGRPHPVLELALEGLAASRRKDLRALRTLTNSARNGEADRQTESDDIATRSEGGRPHAGIRPGMVVRLHGTCRLSFNCDARCPHVLRFRLREMRQSRVLRSAVSAFHPFATGLSSLLAK